MNQKTTLLRLLLSLFAVVLVSVSSFAQITSGSISGHVADSKGEDLPGATVVAIHVPTGTKYASVTNIGGRYEFPNVRTGGPYKIDVTYVGYNPGKKEIPEAILGINSIVNFSLGDDSKQLGEVTVTASKDEQFNNSKMGTATNISNKQLVNMPTISRSLTDFTRLTPQANGNNFGGTDGRYNNIQIDGANLNNNFGLSNDPLPGGGSNPISLDAIDQVSVNIAPFDVRLSNFTGAGISATTKSGDNTLKGSVYGYYRNQNYNGTHIADYTIPSTSISQTSNKIFGGTLGGAIIKNKLFYFVSAESEERTYPGIAYGPSNTKSGIASTTSADSLAAVSNYLQNKYNYSTGAYDNFPSFKAKNTKLLGKLDWNINDRNKLTLKVSNFTGSDQQTLNGTSVPNGLSRLANNRFSNKSMSYENSNYGFDYKVTTVSVELNTKISNTISNQAIATYTNNSTIRNFNGGIFPTIDILDGKGGSQLTAGMDPFTNNNDVENKVANFVDNVTILLGKHKVTAGGTFEFNRVQNMFMAGSAGYFKYASVSDFVNDKAPIAFAYTYSLVPGTPNVFSADLKLGQLGLYAQDEFNVNNKLVITAGLRIDRPMYLNTPIDNPASKNIQFYADPSSTTKTNYSNTFPKSQMYVSPRIGFRYDKNADGNLIIRGGTGLFTGRIPLVWLTNIPSNSGMYQFGVGISKASDLANIRFTTNPSEIAAKYPALFPTTTGTALPSATVFAANNFKFPQVWRTNIGADKQLGQGWTITGDFIFSKAINNVRMWNANLNPVTGQLAGADNRDVITGTNKLNSAIGSAIVLDNTKKGYTYSATVGITKSSRSGFFGSLAYTRTMAKDITANPGSQASSVWNANPNVGTSNSAEMGYSGYFVPNRIVGSVSYRKEYIQHLATTVSLFYEGSSQGNYSYTINSDINGDGNGTTDLMYIPKNASEFAFKTLTAGSNTYTAQQQSDAMMKYIDQDKYLSKHKGEYAQRNAAWLPWYNRLDMKFMQDFYLTVKNTKHTLQFTADILNVLNLVNKSWGVKQVSVLANPLKYTGLDATSKQPVYQWTEVTNADGTKGLATESFTNLKTSASTWGIQIGLRYKF